MTPDTRHERLSPVAFPVTRHARALVWLLLLGLLGTLGAAAQERGELLDPELRDLFHEALSGEQAKDYVIGITRHHRVQASRGYRKAAEYVMAALEGSGFGEEDAWLESFVSDGHAEYQTWQSPSGWDIDWAELRMLEPRNERIVGYPEIAMSLVTYSNPDDVTAELVWVGDGTREEDYRGTDVGGKLVLCTGYGGRVHRLAVLEHGALGVVCFLDDERAQEYPDMLQYTGMWPLTDEIESTTFGFNLTHRQGTALRELLESGERVVMRAQVRGTGLEPFYLDVPVARIQGSDRAGEELILSAHLDHPKESANDNASGSAALMDMAITLKTLIDSGRLPRPERSIRFLWVPEFYGSLAYVDAHPEMQGPSLGGSVLGNLNMDMVGEDLEKIHTKMILTRTPASIPSVFNDVVENMAQMVDRMEIRTPRGSLSAFNYRLTPYSGGSDHNVFIDRKVPGMMVNHAPDYTHHTSEDTPDKVDPVELERSEVLATGAIWYLANLDGTQAMELVHLAAANAAGRLGETGRAAVRMILDAPEPRLADTAAEAHNRIDHALRWEQEAVRSVLIFHDDPAVAERVEGLEGQLAVQHESLSRGLRSAFRGKGGRSVWPPPLARLVDDRVPWRVTRGPLDSSVPTASLDEGRARWYESAEAPGGTERFEMVNFIDGRRTVAEIRDAVSAEFGPMPTTVVARYLEDLVTAGVVEWR